MSASYNEHPLVSYEPTMRLWKAQQEIERLGAQVILDNAKHAAAGGSITSSSDDDEVVRHRLARSILQSPHMFFSERVVLLNETENQESGDGAAHHHQQQQLVLAAKHPPHPPPPPYHHHHHHLHHHPPSPYQHHFYAPHVHPHRHFYNHHYHHHRPHRPRRSHRPHHQQLLQVPYCIQTPATAATTTTSQDKHTTTSIRPHRQAVTSPTSVVIPPTSAQQHHQQQDEEVTSWPSWSCTSSSSFAPVHQVQATTPTRSVASSLSASPHRMIDAAPTTPRNNASQQQQQQQQKQHPLLGVLASAQTYPQALEALHDLRHELLLEQLFICKQDNNNDNNNSHHSQARPPPLLTSDALVGPIQAAMSRIVQDWAKPQHWAIGAAISDILGLYWTATCDITTGFFGGGITDSSDGSNDGLFMAPPIGNNNEQQQRQVAATCIVPILLQILHANPTQVEALQLLAQPSLWQRASSTSTADYDHDNHQNDDVQLLKRQHFLSMHQRVTKQMAQVLQHHHDQQHLQQQPAASKVVLMAQTLACRVLELVVVSSSGMATTADEQGDGGPSALVLLLLRAQVLQGLLVALQQQLQLPKAPVGPSNAGGGGDDATKQHVHFVKQAITTLCHWTRPQVGHPPTAKSADCDATAAAAATATLMGQLWNVTLQSMASHVHLVELQTNALGCLVHLAIQLLQLPPPGGPTTTTTTAASTGATTMVASSTTAFTTTTNALFNGKNNDELPPAGGSTSTIVTAMQTHPNSAPLQALACQVLSLVIQLSQPREQQQQQQQLVVVVNRTSTNNKLNPARRRAHPARRRARRRKKTKTPSHAETSSTTSSHDGFHQPFQHFHPEQDAAVLRAILAAMRHHSQQVAVQRYGCRALLVLAHWNYRLGRTTMLGGNNNEQQGWGIRAILSQVVRAMQMHSTHAQLQQDACAVVANLALDMTHRIEMLRIATVDRIPVGTVVLAAMKLHPMDIRVQRKASIALCHLLSARNPTSCRDYVFQRFSRTIVQAGAVELLLSALQSHPSRDRLRGAACGALSNLIVIEDAANDHESGVGAIKAAIAQSGAAKIFQYVVQRQQPNDPAVQ